MLYSRAGFLADASQQELTQRLRQGSLVRLASGVYVDGVDLSGWPEAIHALKTRAHAHCCAHVVSHVSAAVVHGLPVPGADLSEVHFSRPGHSGNDLIGDRRVHAGCPDDNWLADVDGMRVTNVARTVVDLARTQPHLAAVAATDAALHRGLVDPAGLVEAFQAEARWVGSPRARSALTTADGRAESPGETWARLALVGLHPGLELQFNVYDEDGRFVARADGGYPELGLVWEYDGQGKYEELRAPGTTRDDVMAKQRRRQGHLESLGWTVIRGGGEDLRDKQAFRDRVVQVLQAAGTEGWAPPKGRYELTPPLTVNVREPVQWAAAMREELHERWISRHLKHRGHRTGV